jgi:hypothetical protein
MQKHLPPASCQACPGMALFLPEPMRLPLRVAIDVFVEPASSKLAGIIPVLDTPPPRSFVVV